MSESVFPDGFYELPIREQMPIVQDMILTHGGLVINHKEVRQYVADNSKELYAIFMEDSTDE